MSENDKVREMLAATYRAQVPPDKADVYYAMSDKGIWFPETICKPFLRSAVQETEGLMQRWAELNTLFRPSEKDDDKAQKQR